MVINMEKSKTTVGLKETPASLRARKFLNAKVLKNGGMGFASLNSSNSSFKSQGSFSYLSNISTANDSMRESVDFKIAHTPYHMPHQSVDLSKPPQKKPLTLSEVIKANAKLLNRFELREIQKFKNIYFFRKSFVDYTEEYFYREGEYFAIIGDAICYRYEITEFIDSGSFGQVLKCIDHKDGAQVAVKVLANHYNSKKLGMNEYRIVESLNKGKGNNSIVKVKKRFVFRHHFFMVFELLGINLYKFLHFNGFKPLSISLAKRFAAQLLKGLKHMHENSIIHCDLKPENIVLKQSNKSSVRIIDFGTACVNKNVIFTYFQTRLYRAPEVVLQIGNYGPEIDIWSLGCVVCELLLGVPLFSGENEKQLLVSMCEVLGAPPDELLISAKTDFELCILDWKKKPTLRKILKGYSEEILIFLESCLKWNPQERITASDGLLSTWFQSSHSRSSSVEILKRPR